MFPLRHCNSHHLVAGTDRGVVVLADIFVQGFGPGMCIFCALSQVGLRPPIAFPSSFVK